jgi:hypothetical protein
MLELRTDPSFTGPTLIELEPILGDLTGKVQARWLGSKAEQAILARNVSIDFILWVSDTVALERAANTLGVGVTLDSSTLMSAQQSLISKKAYNWRPLVNDFGVPAANLYLLRITSDAVRRGKRPNLVKVMTECVLDGVSTIDADVLLRLRSLGVK